MDDLSTILLIEDNPDDVELVTHAFRKAEIPNPLIVVDDGDKAIDYLKSRAAYSDRAKYPLPGLILLDLKLPRRSGFEVLEAIRANEETRRTPVVVLTSSNQETDIERAYDVGANSYLVKPGDLSALVELVKSVDAYWITLNMKPGAENVAGALVNGVPGIRPVTVGRGMVSPTAEPRVSWVTRETG